MKNVYNIAALGIILAVIGIIITISGIKVFDITLSEWEWPKSYWAGKSPTKVEDVRGEPKDSKRTVPPQNREGKVTKLSVSEVRISLKSMLDSDKLQFIEDNINSMPDNLFLEELNSILTLFVFSDSKVRVTKVFAPRVKRNFSDSELEKFAQLFSFSDSRKEALSLLYGRKK